MSHNAGVQAKPRKVLTSRNRHEIAEIGAGNDARARAEAHLQKRAPKIGVPCRAAGGEWGGAICELTSERAPDRGVARLGKYLGG